MIARCRRSSPQPIAARAATYDLSRRWALANRAGAAGPRGWAPLSLPRWPRGDPISWGSASQAAALPHPGTIHRPRLGRSRPGAPAASAPSFGSHLPPGQEGTPPYGLFPPSPRSGSGPSAARPQWVQFRELPHPAGWPRSLPPLRTSSARHSGPLNPPGFAGRCCSEPLIPSPLMVDGGCPWPLTDLWHTSGLYGGRLCGPRRPSAHPLGYCHVLSCIVAAARTRGCPRCAFARSPRRHTRPFGGK